MTQAELSSDDQALLVKYRAKADANGGSIAHDLNDPEQLAFVKLMHNLCGNTEEDFPGLHAMLAAPQPEPVTAESAPLDDVPGWQTTFDVPEIGPVTVNNVAAANGYGTVVGGFQTCNLSLLVLGSGSSLLAHGSNAGQAPLATLPVSTDDSTAQPFPPGASAMMTYSYLPPSGPSVSGTVTRAAPAAVQDPTVTEPKRENGNTTPYNPSNIIIGLGRPFGNLFLVQCDYVYGETTQLQPVGRVPLVGNVTFNGAIQALQPGTNLLVDVYVIQTTGGKSVKLLPSDLNNIYANFNIVPGNPNQLEWRLPMQANTNPPEPPQAYNPVVFTNIPWSSDATCYLTVNITAWINDGSGNFLPVAVTIQSSDSPDSDPIDGIRYIMPIEFIWHCLGEDTEVTMGDGSTRTIPRIKSGDEVLCGVASDRSCWEKWRGKGKRNGKVAVTHNGAHFQTVHVLETVCGKSLVASAEHVIFTPDGGVAARQLTAGMQVVTADGPTELRSVREEDGNGRNLWNLSLGQAPQMEETKPDVGQFYANGILVGDARATRAMRYARINDIDWVKAHVPESFHKDVETTFRRRTRVTTR